MSADNFYIVKPHPSGGFTYVQGFASDEEAGPWLTPTVEHRQWPTVALALQAAMNDYSEYGVSVDPSCGDWAEDEPEETKSQPLPQWWVPSTIVGYPSPGIGPVAVVLADEAEKHETNAVRAARQEGRESIAQMWDADKETFPGRIIAAYDTGQAEGKRDSLAEITALRQVVAMLGANENTEALIELAMEANDLMYANGQRDALTARTLTAEDPEPADRSVILRHHPAGVFAFQREGDDWYAAGGDPIAVDYAWLFEFDCTVTLLYDGAAHV